ncbi:MAG TPA: fused MFS/spermidine synthase [Dongiaceae bacterium]|nr:fused MFS/spermidine synthase [Dongiaceae bacterium]
MMTGGAEPPNAAPLERAALPLLLALFFGSGCAALIYEIVWFQLLQLVIGSSAVSLGVLLGVFMGGMCLGSLALPRWVPRHWHPLRVYACLEAGLGLCGLSALLVVPLVGRLYASLAGPGLMGLLLRGLACGTCLLPPTLLMGATLPAIARGLKTTPAGVSWLGFFYGGNIAGAVVGCLLGGFSLLRYHDMRTATCLAAAINAAVSLLGFGLASLRPHPHAAPQSDDLGATPEAPHFRLVSLAVALSGFCALSAEVVWTRLLSLMLGPTVYAFCIILAVFLVGLGAGSGAGAWLARRTANARAALGACQLLLAVAIGWAALMLGCSLPFWPINPSLSRNLAFNFQLDLVRCAWVLLPATCLWGASFPLALAAAASGRGDPGRLVGRIYAANTLGAIIGALACSLLLIHSLGTRQIERLLIVLSVVSGLLMFWPRPAETTPQGGSRPPAGAGTGRARLLCGTLGLAALLAWSVPRVPWELVAYGRYLATKTELGSCLFMGEGLNASVAVTQLSDGVRNFHISGKVEASTEPRDMRLQRMLGHIPGLLHPRPQSVLIVGCGAGVTAGSFVGYPEVKRLVICELEPLIPRAVAQFFAKENEHVLNDPRTQVVYDDARHYILTTRDKFDVITSDPIHPWVKGAATLYTKEYFELCRQHLNPGGLMTQWVPLYESNLAVVRSEMATFFSVFPNGTIWSNDDQGEGYDVVLLGSAGDTRIDLDRVQRRLSREDYGAVRASLRSIGCRSALALLASYAGQAKDLAPWLQKAQINLDRNLRLQYLAGLGLNFYEQSLIYADLELYLRFPDELFAGPQDQKQALRRLVERSHRKTNP